MHDDLPIVTYEQAEKTHDYLHRIGQIIGKYTLEQPYSFAWATISLLTTPRGFMSRQMHGTNGIIYQFIVDVFTNNLEVISSRGTAQVGLRDNDTVADFYARFLQAASSVGVKMPITPVETELEHNLRFEADTEPRRYDATVARKICTMYAVASAGLEAWQTNFVGFQAAPGIMWGGFDLSTVRYNGKPAEPHTQEEIFKQNAELGEAIVYGFWLGTPDSSPGFYAYVTPQPVAMQTVDFGETGANWSDTDGMVVLSWEKVVASDNPIGLIVRLGDILYQAAIDQNGWPDAMTIERCDGHAASKRLISLPSAAK